MISLQKLFGQYNSDVLYFMRTTGMLKGLLLLDIGVDILPMACANATMFFLLYTLPRLSDYSCFPHTISGNTCLLY